MANDVERPITKLRPQRKVRSWDVEWRGIWTHVSDLTRGQAAAEVLRRIYDAGYYRKDVGFTDLKVVACIAGGCVWCRAWQPKGEVSGG